MQNTAALNQENDSEKVVCQMEPVYSRPQYVK